MNTNTANIVMASASTSQSGATVVIGGADTNVTVESNAAVQGSTTGEVNSTETAGDAANEAVPTEGAAANTEGETAPVEGEAAANTEGEAAPAEGEAVTNTEGETAPAEGETTANTGEEAVPAEGREAYIDPKSQEGMNTNAVFGTEMAQVNSKDPLLSSWPFVIGISAAVLCVSIVLGVLLAKLKIKKGIDIYED